MNQEMGQDAWRLAIGITAGILSDTWRASGRPSVRLTGTPLSGVSQRSRTTWRNSALHDAFRHGSLPFLRVSDWTTCQPIRDLQRDALCGCAADTRNGHPEPRWAPGVSDVLWLLTIGEGLLIALMGVVAGLVVALQLTGVMAHLFVEVNSTDPAVFIIVPLVLVVVALLACYLPARRRR